MTKDARPGESLWCEWSGSGYRSDYEYTIVYYTFDRVDLENEVVRRALASTIQRDGIESSLGEGFKSIDTAKVVYGWAGILTDELDFWACDELGETEYGDTVEDVKEITWVEF